MFDTANHPIESNKKLDIDILFTPIHLLVGSESKCGGRPLLLRSSGYSGTH